MNTTTDKTSYAVNQTATLKCVVKAGGVAVAGAKVNFTITKSNGTQTQLGGTTGSDGAATVKYRFNKQDPKGTYQDKASTTVNGISGVATTSFVVQ